MNGNDKRLVANTVILYLRMLLVMGLSFLTTRILLKAFGVDDFGLVNVIASVASMFAFVTSTFSTGCARYCSFSIGRKDEAELGRVFSVSVLLYGLAAIVLLVLFETVGLWYVNTKLVCDASRVAAARTFYQLVIGQTLIAWMAGPYQSLLIAYENMTAYAILSLVDGSLRFAVAVALTFFVGMDRLVSYGWLSLGIAACSLALAHGMVRRNYPSLKSPLSAFGRSDSGMGKLLWEICAFNGWRMTNVLSWTAGNVLVNLLLNAFFGPAVNAARAIAMQVQTGARALNENFLTAVRPQFVKSWAAGCRRDFHRLLVRSVIVSVALVSVFAVPLFVLVEWVLKVWLGNVPAYAVSFTRIVLATTVVNAVIHPLNAAVHAIGEIRLYELTGALVFGLAWPLSYLALHLGYGPTAPFWIVLLLSVLSNAAQGVVAMKLLCGNRRSSVE